MFRRLLESQARQLQYSEGALVSVVAHTAFIALAVVATHRPADVVPDEKETDSAVFYLFPENRSMHPPPKQESIRWVDVGAGVGDLGIEMRDVDKDSPGQAVLAGQGTDEKQSPSMQVPPDEWTLPDSVHTEIDVDSTVMRYPESAAPAYPRDMLDKKIEGNAYVQFVVDTTGLADTTSFRVLTTTHQAFAGAVRQALPLMRFRPAILQSRKVRQLVEQSFSFKIVPPETLKQETAAKSIP